jgi:hypothetical protein
MCVDVDAYVDVDADAYADEYLPASMAVSNLATTSDPATPEICDLTLLSTNLDLKITKEILISRLFLSFNVRQHLQITFNLHLNNITDNTIKNKTKI